MQPMGSVTLTIDGKTIIAGEDTTILEAALNNGIYIPHLCSHESLLPAGACRMCVVKVEGMDGVVASCAVKVADGMSVDTNDELAEKIRKLSCDLICKTHPSECTNCPKYGKCQLQTIIQYVGDTGRKLRSNQIITAKDESNPIVMHEMVRCILCGRCVRACADLRGVGALKFEKVKGRMQVVIDGESLKSANCRFCSACVEVCPTGSIREHEEIAEKLIGKTREQGFVPCREGCPAHIDIPRYIRHLRNGEYSEATAVIREKAPLPHSLGFVCSHPCEPECKRSYLNEPVSIRDLKRFAASRESEDRNRRQAPAAPTGKKVAVIGAGPAGVTCAHYLAGKGHLVDIFEEKEKPGGMMRYGIPQHRLPREILDGEIDAALEQGVNLHLNKKVDNAPSLLDEGYDAVFAAVGTHKSALLSIPGHDFDGVLLSAGFLHDAEMGIKPTIGRTAVVLGGGNVAMDCAAVAGRLGAETVYIACLESYDKMTASAQERAIAEEEGVIILNDRTFLEITGEQGCVTGIKVATVSSFSFDENGKSTVDIRPDSEETIAADTVIFAIGQRPDIDEGFGIGLTRGSRIVVANECETSVVGVFAAGDSVTGTDSVIKAIAGARTAAERIDRYLGGDGIIDNAPVIIQQRDQYLGCVDGFADMPRKESRMLPLEERHGCFKQIDLGFDESAAAAEADRCLQCDLRLDIMPQRFWTDYADVMGQGSNPGGGERSE